MGVFLSSAYDVLKQEGRPLTAQEITATAIARGLLRSTGQTPSQTMKAKLSVDILRNGPRSLFKRSEKARFALREWTEVREHVADRYQKALFDEDIVVFPTKLRSTYVPTVGLNTGKLDSEGLLAECYPMRRRLAEEDTSVIQLISVFVVRHSGRILTYKRSKRLPESRLHGFYSVAFGGHLNPEDVLHMFNIFDPEQSHAWLTRELYEELRWEENSNQVVGLDYVGLLYDDSQPVSRQHLGLVYDVTLLSDKFNIGERGFLMDPQFETLEQIQSRIAEFENWSVILIESEANR
jgi:predicted NUDIX family phosphoesterase